MARPAPVFSLQELLLTEAVKDLEAATPLQDDRAMREAIAATPLRDARIVQRALTLAADTGLDSDAAWLRRALPMLGLAAVAAGVLFAALLTVSLLGDGRRINALAALALLVLPNLAGIVAWALFAALPGRGGAGVLGHAAAWLGKRGPWQRRAARVVPAALRLLDRSRLSPWLLGGLNHLLWAVAYLLAALGLVAVLSLAEYRLGFETTLLAPQTLHEWARGIAWWPAQLGLPAQVPDPADAAGASHALGWWLVSGTLAYGALPRLLLLALCAVVARARAAALSLDTQDPYYRTLINRFEALAPTLVLDAEQAAPPARRDAARLPAAGGTLALIGFELPPEDALPSALLAEAAWSERIEGRGDERAALLQRLAAAPPARLLVVCHAASTPDRGTGRFLDGARPVPTALLLVPAALASGALLRWRGWLDAAGRTELPVFADADEARHWSSHG
jgi:Protein of unknown function (DUF2868)